MSLSIALPVEQIDPYRSAEEMVEQYLVATRARIDHAAARRWPADLLLEEGRLRARTEITTVPLPLAKLATQFDLDVCAQRVLWILLAHELCPTSRVALRALSTEQSPDPTTAVIRTVAFGNQRDRVAWDVLSESHPLRRWNLIERSDGHPDASEYRQTWRVARRVLALAYGVIDLDVGDVGLSPRFTRDQLEYPDGVVAAVQKALRAGQITIVWGKSGVGKRSLLERLSPDLLPIDGVALAKKDREQRARQIREIAREARLHWVPVLITRLDALDEEAVDLIETVMEGRFLATATRRWARRWRHPAHLIEVGDLSGPQRLRLWQKALPMIACDDLAVMYPLVPAYIEAVGQAACALAGETPLTEDHVTAGVSNVLDDRLTGLATRISTKQDWADVVLSTDQVDALTELVARVRERQLVHETWGFADKIGRGLGVAALFSGPPGTGKTMVAGIVAKTLGLPIYQIDTSKITSKWIGETEKNLAALFDAAEAGHAILLFDEADSLFGKRTEVKSSNDRHANQEINYLLQRIESFTGMCILTTNHESAIDEAFRRRLASHVRFDIPDRDERAQLWRALLPTAAPQVGDLGIEKLAATYVMSGGYIRNAVLRAAFLAADDRGAIDATRLARAAQLEYETMGKIAPSQT